MAAAERYRDDDRHLQDPGSNVLEAIAPVLTAMDSGQDHLPVVPVETIK